MTTILVVDDEPIVRDVIVRYLKRDGFSTLEAADGDRARELIETGGPELVVLDLMLPGTDGLELCRWIRSRSDLPVIMLTARGEEADRIVGLELGADDYVTKPFSVRELVLRVRARLRTAAAREPLVEGEAAPIRIGPLEVIPEAHRVLVGGQEVYLSLLEFKLLLHLIERRGRVQSREALLGEVWGYAEDTSSRTIDTHVKRLRDKLGEVGNWLETIRGVGYMFSPKLEEE